MNPTLMDTEIAQESRLVTEIPGPRSQGLLAKKTEAVSSGVGVGLPVFIERAGGGVLVDVDGNRFEIADLTALDKRSLAAVEQVL